MRKEKRKMGRSGLFEQTGGGKGECELRRKADKGMMYTTLSI